MLDGVLPPVLPSHSTLLDDWDDYFVCGQREIAVFSELLVLLLVDTY